MQRAIKQFTRIGIAALLFGASFGLLFGLVWGVFPQFFGESKNQKVEERIAPRDELVKPEFAYYVEIIDGCDHNFVGTCAHVYHTPSFAQPKTSIRNGAVLKVSDIVANESGLWYRIIFDEWVRYPNRITHAWYIPANNARLFIDPGILETHANTTVPKNKSILVDRSSQTLQTFENGTLIMSLHISTGLLMTPTPRGTFTIFKKTPTRYMQGPLPGVSGQYYDLPGVPWNLYFTEQGGAIHGAYWHANFGRPWSHGCVNVSLNDAEALYQWADVGTQVIVRD